MAPVSRLETPARFRVLGSQDGQQSALRGEDDVLIVLLIRAAPLGILSSLVLVIRTMVPFLRDS